MFLEEKLDPCQIYNASPRYCTERHELSSFRKSQRFYIKLILFEITPNQPKNLSVHCGTAHEECVCVFVYGDGTVFNL